MKKQKWVVALGLAIGVIVGFSLFIYRQQSAKGPAKQPPASAPAAETVSRSETDNAPKSPPALSDAASHGRHMDAALPAPETSVSIRAEQPVATVNGVKILGKDLTPLSAAHEEKQLTPETFEFLRGLAIERELVFQAAGAQGITLTEQQKLQLDQVRKSLLQQEGAASNQIVHLNRTGTLEDEISFEVRDATSHLLQASLMEKAGAPPPYVTQAAVEKYYQEHAAEFKPLPDSPTDRSKVWQEIGVRIRQQLTLITLQAYQRASEEYMDGLKSKAAISTN